MSVEKEIVANLLEDCNRGKLNIDEVLEATLNKLYEIDPSAVLSMAADQGFIISEDFGDDTLDLIEKEIDHDEELTPQQRIIEKVLARYGDL